MNVNATLMVALGTSPVREVWLSSSYEKVLAILAVFKLEENPETIQYRGSQALKKKKKIGHS